MDNNLEIELSELSIDKDRNIFNNESEYQHLVQKKKLRTTMLSYIKGLNFKSTFIQTNMIYKYSVNEIKKQSQSFKISLLTVFITVAFLCIIYNIIQMSAIMFIHLAENNIGDGDIAFIPNSIEEQSAYNKDMVFPKLINSTKFSEVCDELDNFFVGCSPRWYFQSYAYRKNDSSEAESLNRIFSNVIYIDFEKENSIGLKKRIQVKNIQENQAIITKETYYNLNLQQQNLTIKQELQQKDINYDKDLHQIFVEFDVFNDIFLSFGLLQNQEKQSLENSIDILKYKKQQREGKEHTFFFQDFWYNSTIQFILNGEYQNFSDLQVKYQNFEILNQQLSSNEVNRNKNNTIRLLAQIIENKLQQEIQKFKDFMFSIQNETIAINSQFNDFFNESQQAYQIINQMSEYISNADLNKTNLYAISNIIQFLLNNYKFVDKIIEFLLLDETKISMQKVNLNSNVSEKLNSSRFAQILYSNENLIEIMKFIHDDIHQQDKRFYNFLIQLNISIPSNQTFQQNYDISLGDIIQSFISIVVEASKVNLDLRVKHVIQDQEGSFPYYMSNIIILDKNFVTKQVMSQFLQNLNQQIQESQDQNDQNYSNFSINLFEKQILEYIFQDQKYQNLILQQDQKMQNLINENAFIQYAVLKNRFDLYSSKKSTHNKMIEITNAFYKKLNESSLISEPQAPLEFLLSQFHLTKNFLDNLFFSSIFILLTFSIILIYSIISLDLFEKIYQYGILRVLGATQNFLIKIFSCKTIFYSLPGYFLGMLLAIISLFWIKNQFFSTIQESGTYHLESIGNYIGIFVGIVIPFAISYQPIKQVIQRYLKNSLSINMHVQQISIIDVKKLEKLGISSTQTLIAFSLIIIGILTYYFAPISFLYENIKLFLIIMNVVLLFLIGGVTSFFNLFQNFFEQKIVLRILMLIFVKAKNLQFIIQKNLQAHSNKNRSNTLLLTMTYAFLIFISVGFKQQEYTIIQIIRNNVGSDIRVNYILNQKILFNDKVELIGNQIYNLPEYKLRKFLEEYNQTNPNQIDEYTFASKLILRSYNKASLSSLSGFPSMEQAIVGIEPNFFKTIFHDTFIWKEQDPTFEYLNSSERKYFDQGLYSVKGLIFDKKNETNEIIDQNFIMTLSNVRRIQEDQSEENELLKILQKANDSQDFINNLNSSFYIQRLRIIPLIISYDKKESLGIKTNMTTLLNFKNNKVKFLAQIRAMASKMGGDFGFSSYGPIAKEFAFTSMPHYSFLVDYIFNHNMNLESSIFENEKQQQIHHSFPNNTFGIPKSSLFIKFKRPLNIVERNFLKNGLRKQINTQLIYITDYSEREETVHIIFYYINWFQIVVTVISLIMSFFLLLITFSSNIKINQKEIGVLRAVGISNKQFLIVYSIEALTIILTCLILGLFIGIIISITLILQIQVFTEDSFQLFFPYVIFILTIIAGVSISFLISFLSIKQLQRKNITSIIKGTDVFQ